MLAVLLTALILTGRQAAADDDEPLRIRGVTYLGDLPTLVADKRGLFEAEGVKPVVKYGFSGVIVALRRTVAGRTETARALLNAYRAAIGFIDRQGQRALAMFADHAGVSIESVRRLQSGLSFELNLDWSVVATLQQQLTWARDAGYAGEDSVADVLGLFEARPLRSVAPASVGLPARDTDTRSGWQ